MLSLPKGFFGFLSVSLGEVHPLTLWEASSYSRGNDEALLAAMDHHDAIQHVPTTMTGQGYTQLRKFFEGTILCLLLKRETILGICKQFPRPVSPA